MLLQNGGVSLLWSSGITILSACYQHFLTIDPLSPSISDFSFSHASFLPPSTTGRWTYQPLNEK